MNTRSIAPIRNSDMTHLARLLMAVPRSQRHALAADVFVNAHTAANNTERDSAISNMCGNGTISGAVMQHEKRKSMSREMDFGDDEYRHCWQVALDAVAWHAPVREVAA